MTIILITHPLSQQGKPLMRKSSFPALTRVYEPSYCFKY